MTSQPEGAPTLVGRGGLAAGLGVKSHFLHQADAWSQGAPGLALRCWPLLCLGADAVSSEGTPQGPARRH